MLRRCVWSRNIKNGCSIYIYDISRLRVKKQVEKEACHIKEHEGVDAWILHMGFFTTCINTTTTSSTLWNLYFYPLAPCFYFFLVPLMRLWAFQIDSDITLEVRLLVCLLGLLALRSTPAMSLFTGYKKTWKKKKKRGGRRCHQNRNLSFTVQTICYALCIGYTPSSLIYWSSAGTKWHRDYIGRCVFRFTLVSM